jgi:hypothetical protein
VAPQVQERPSQKWSPLQNVKEGELESNSSVNTSNSANSTSSSSHASSTGKSFNISLAINLTKPGGTKHISTSWADMCEEEDNE